MSIADLLPTLDDAALANLRANAVRLQAGVEGDTQKRAASLLPLIEAELAEREARKPPKPARVVRRKPAARVQS
jgi:hypothetical protein